MTAPRRSITSQREQSGWQSSLLWTRRAANVKYSPHNARRRSRSFPASDPGRGLPSYTLLLMSGYLCHSQPILARLKRHLTPKRALVAAPRFSTARRPRSVLLMAAADFL